MQPASAFFDEYSTAAAQAQAQAQLQAMQQLGGGQMMAMPQQGHGQGMMGMMGAPRALRDDVEAAARFLFFIEKRNALNALLELVQARMGVGLSEVGGLTEHHGCVLVSTRLTGAWFI